MLINQTIQPLHSPSLIKTFNVYCFQIFSLLIKATNKLSFRNSHQALLTQKRRTQSSWWSQGWWGPIWAEQRAHSRHQRGKEPRAGPPCDWDAPVAGSPAQASLWLGRRCKDSTRPCVSSARQEPGNAQQLLPNFPFRNRLRRKLRRGLVSSAASTTCSSIRHRAGTHRANTYDHLEASKRSHLDCQPNEVNSKHTRTCHSVYYRNHFLFCPQWKFGEVCWFCFFSWHHFQPPQLTSPRSYKLSERSATWWGHPLP